MTKAKLSKILEELLRHNESEVVEFKEASETFSTEKVGRYFAALSNEAALREKPCAWFVFGIHDKTHNILGTNWRDGSKAHLDSIKVQTQEQTTTQTTFNNVHEIIVEGKRVLMFEIPPAPYGTPVGYKGHYYARAGESLVPMDIGKITELQHRGSLANDWSAEVIMDVTVDDLDQDALNLARSRYASKLIGVSLQDVNKWSAEIFLQRLKLVTKNGNLTKACLLLFGRPETSISLSPHPAEISWILRDQDKAYEHFSIPLLTTTTKVWQKIRNYEIRILPSNSLAAVGVQKYDEYAFFELLHNCIAHQDYRENARINVLEYDDKIVFESKGDFFEGEPKDYIISDLPPQAYRNKVLADAMVNLGMIDRIGTGINNVCKSAAKRYLPLPDYDLTGQNSVRVTMYGSFLNEDYTKQLIEHPNLDLELVAALDDLQKGRPVATDLLQELRKLKMIGGYSPDIYIAAPGVKDVGLIREKANDTEEFEAMVVRYINKFGSAKRSEINDLIYPYLSDTLTQEQKRAKVGNLLSAMRMNGALKTEGIRSGAVWKLSKIKQD
jgi:ATP-dependent DNA helicase RecG